jgi:hypothetical protein
MPNSVFSADNEKKSSKVKMVLSAYINSETHLGNIDNK